MNTVNLIGRLTKDPELRYTPNGVAVSRFTLAVNRVVKREGQPDADFVSCLAWRKTAENLANYQKKGSQIGVIGHIQTGSFDGQDGKRVFTTDVIAESIYFLDSARTPNGQEQNNNSSYQNYDNGRGVDVTEDDLPF